MTAKQLIDLLKDMNPEAVVVIHRDALNYGFGHVNRITTGLFEDTEYGGEFYSDQKLIVNPKEVSAICIYPKDYVADNG